MLSQTYADFELLIWDDGSTDESVAIARQFEAVDGRVRVIAAAHQGLSVSLRNAIAATPHHPYLGWVDSDDALAPTALEETVAILDAQSQTGMVYTDYRVMNANSQVGGLGSRCERPYSPERLLVEFMTFHFRLLRRSVYEQVGGIDSTFELAEDYDLCLKFSEETEIVHLRRPLYFYRQHGENVTKNNLEMLRWTHRASADALQRRGMDDRYEIHISSELKLQMKPEKWPLVSIIIPCYNAERTILGCLKSCFEQGYPNLEILVVDNNSADGTMALLGRIAETASRPIRVLHCPEPGANHARNYGWRQARGDYIQWLDADDTLMPEKILRQVVTLEQERGYDIAYGDWQWMFYQQQRLIHQLSFTGPFQNDWLLELLMDNWRPPHAYLLRRQAAERLHELVAWNPDTPIGMDREYFTLAALQGFRAVHVLNALVQYNTGLSASQVTLSTPYDVRVQSLKTIFQRFKEQAKHCQGVGPAHRFLLEQNWDLWQPAFSLVKQMEHGCGLQHQETGEQMELWGNEARITFTWLKLAGAFAFEDWSRRIVHQLWQEAVIVLRQTQGLEAALDAQVVNLELAKVLGLVPSAGEMCPLITVEQVRMEPEVTAMLKMPLYAPRFGKERLRVLMVLEQLQQRRLLKQVSEQI